MKCDGILPCARCSKSSLFCVFSPGKKKTPAKGFHLISFFSSFLIIIIIMIKGNQVGFTLNQRENALFSSQVVNFFLNFHFSKMAQFFNGSETKMRKCFPFDSLQVKLQMYSLLSLHFRSDRNLEAAEKFLELLFIYFIFSFF